MVQYGPRRTRQTYGIYNTGAISGALGVGSEAIVFPVPAPAPYLVMFFVYFPASDATVTVQMGVGFFPGPALKLTPGDLHRSPVKEPP